MRRLSKARAGSLLGRTTLLALLAPTAARTVASPTSPTDSPPLHHRPLTHSSASTSIQTAPADDVSGSTQRGEARTGATLAEARGDMRFNVLFIVVDNLRPALGAYGVEEVVTPQIDSFAGSDGAVLFSRAFCQEAWCSPSRNSFLTGRRPQTTQVYNFRDSFREAYSGQPGAGANWVTLPGYFNRSGFYATSSGKVFHPKLPANFDFPLSWSDQPLMQEKYECRPPNASAANMSCEFATVNSSHPDPSLPQYINADAQTATDLIGRLEIWKAQSVASRNPFFAAAGFQGPRLPWSYPSEAAAAYPESKPLPLPQHKESPLSPSEGAEWFRPVEVAGYGDVVASGGVTHQHPLSDTFQHGAKRAYYAAITNVDTQVGVLLSATGRLGVADDTVVVLTADHAQNLGEANMWSMMNLLETSLRVPLIIRPAASDARFHKAGRVPLATVYPHPVELVDLYPTLASLGNLAPPPAGYKLEGDNLVPGMLTGGVAKPTSAAFGQITRCMNCSQAYGASSLTRGCLNDEVDAGRFYVPCADTNRSEFDLMGITVRTSDWRYTAFCVWNGEALRVDLDQCGWHELYDHRNDTVLYDVDHSGEYTNVVNVSGNAGIRAQLDSVLRAQFSKP